MDTSLITDTIGLVAMLAVALSVLAVALSGPAEWRVISPPRTSIDIADPGSLVHDVGKVPIIADFGDKIVYTTDSSLDPIPFAEDCGERGGIFLTCGSMCAPDAELCAGVCAYTCDVSLPAYFTVKMREGAVERVGQPIEGFEPFMFMEAFPGLVPDDLKGVEALLGVYSVVDGEVVFTEIRGEVVHTAARAVSDEGMAMLLENVGARLGVDLTGRDAVDRIVEELDTNE